MRSADPKELGPVADFSRIAIRYDATRDIPRRCLDLCYDRLVAGGLLPDRGAILDAGCGTGQISLPLAARGYDVLGVDISREMVALAQAKVASGWQARYAIGDVRKLAAGDGGFDAVVVSKLFQHIEDWQSACRELIRVVRPGGSIIQINERGAFGNAVRRTFARRASERGFKARHLGLDPHSEGALRTFMAAQGCRVLPVETSDIRWEAAITYGEALARLRDRLFAEFWNLPAEAYDQILADTAAWIEGQAGGPSAVDRLEPYLVVEVFRTPAATPDRG
jgi:ubiquinone/menaquinone biosynthesis C-methylase UbiE